MNFDEETYEAIERYLNNTLSKSERNHFEQRIATDSALKEEVDINKAMKMHLNDTTDKHLDYHPEAKSLEACFRTPEIKELEESIAQGQRIYIDRQNKSKLKKYCYYAAAILITGLIVGQFFRNTSEPDTIESLYTTYSNWEDLPAITSKNAAQEDVLARGVTLYQQNKYTKAISILNEAMNQTTDINPHVLIYLGVSYLKIDATQKAKDTFELLLQNKTLESNKAYWYIAMTCMKQGNKTEALRYLDLLLQNKKNYQYHEAKNLMPSLKKAANNTLK